MKTLFAAIALSVFLTAQASAAPLPMSSDGPVDVTADSMVYNSDKNTVSFQGGVEATRGEFKLWADSLTIFLRGSGEKGGDVPDRRAVPFPRAVRQNIQRFNKSVRFPGLRAFDGGGIFRRVRSGAGLVRLRAPED